jgi:hypothetical protein
MDNDINTILFFSLMGGGMRTVVDDKSKVVFVLN